MLTSSPSRGVGSCELSLGVLLVLEAGRSGSFNRGTTGGLAPPAMAICDPGRQWD